MSSRKPNRGGPPNPSAPNSGGRPKSGTTVSVAGHVGRSLLRGNPWVFRQALQRAPQLASGTVVDVTSEGASVGFGLWDAASPIAVRMFGEAPSEALFRQRLTAALHLRQTLLANETTTAMRLVNGEGDRIPGLVIDRYGSVAVMKLDGEHLTSWLPTLAPLLLAQLDSFGIETLALRHARSEGKGFSAHWGKPPPTSVRVLEHGRHMHVDIASGQKTGAFLDQRENRTRVQTLAKGRSNVLNLFSYSGGFSVAAGLGGGVRVTSVDLAPEAMRAAQEAFKDNGLSPRDHEFVVSDCFRYLETAQTRDSRFDLIICDPPSFAPSEKAKPNAIKAYRKLHGLCASLLSEHGLLCASSCSSHLPMQEFLQTLDDEALGRTDLRVLEAHGQPLDHPTTAGWPEGRYLKFVVMG